MSKQNCWEFKKCGREPGGAKEKELGVCPAAIDKRLDSANEGDNGGRACWILAGTLCGNKVQGSFASKVGNCLQCEFYKKVRAEQGECFENANALLKKLK